MEAIPALDNGRVTETRLRTLNAHQALAALRYRSSLPDLHRPSANAASPPQTVEKLYRSAGATQNYRRNQLNLKVNYIWHAACI